MANNIDELGNGDERSGRWSWNIWLFYLACILAIALATTVSGRAHAQGWWNGTLGQGDTFYNYNSRDFR